MDPMAGPHCQVDKIGGGGDESGSMAAVNSTIINTTFVLIPLLLVTGTVGEWLKYAASPLERKNFEEFLQLLEEFEYDRGLSHRRLEDPVRQEGIVMKLGAMLSVKMSFHVCTDHA